MSLFKRVGTLFFICLFLFAVSCTSDNAGGAKGDDPFFMLKELSQTDGRLSFDMTADRFYEEFTDSVVPSAEYGGIVPYIGGYYKYESAGEDGGILYSPVYGFCTSTGKIVTDPVYDSVKRYSLDDSSDFYVLTKGSDGGFGGLPGSWIAAGDGSWIFEIPAGCRLTDSNGGGFIILERTRTTKQRTFIYYDVYDRSGQLAFTVDKTLAEAENTTYTMGRFSEGLAPVNVVLSEPNEEDIEAEPIKTFTAFYIDGSGKRLYEKFSFADEFRGGYAVVADADGKYGVINVNGEYVIEPRYRVINYNYEKGYFACGADTYFDILDINGTQVRRVLSERGNVEVMGSDVPIYKKTNGSTGKSEYFYIDSGKPFICEETGQFPDESGGAGGIYTCSYGGRTTVFDESGKTVTVLDETGSVMLRYGNRAVVVNSDGTKTAVIPLTYSKFPGWTDKSAQSGQTVSEKYIVLADNNGDYSLYDIESGASLYDGSDFMTVYKTASAEYLLVFKDGITSVYKGALDKITSFRLAGVR